MAKDWTAKKLEVLVDVPDTLNLEHLRGTGPQLNEELQPEVSHPNPLVGAQIDSCRFGREAVV